MKNPEKLAKKQTDEERNRQIESWSSSSFSSFSSSSSRFSSSLNNIHDKTMTGGWGKVGGEWGDEWMKWTGSHAGKWRQIKAIKKQLIEMITGRTRSFFYFGITCRRKKGNDRKKGCFLFFADKTKVWQIQMAEFFLKVVECKQKLQTAVPAATKKNNRDNQVLTRFMC